MDQLQAQEATKRRRKKEKRAVLDFVELLAIDAWVVVFAPLPAAKPNISC